MPPPPVAVYRSDDFLARTAFFLRFPVAALTEELENRTPSEQRTLIGETLYPLVELLQPLFAPKITGMLLELPRTQIFRCIESPEVLKEKVNEAIDVLVDWYPQQMKLNEQEAKEFRAAMLLSKL
ncbi:PREDICTED: maternally expressed PAB C-terminal protein-like [Brassica oleracea var. oleracea]|uniref:PABC domain-containing protein n=1 Tax=Brassica oleracea var. oleracea TaxID=109376 RepID=A0A0D3BC54_BRAOL|nr:PREDICTED: maternally expressed PAB C-terminal protein-like [Brassica oleracea var. oleracea]XP_013628006.1 PREDICTED: maternally expressed PAB C-terminal protein-like [Brassica oleracea var. oleracea]